MNTYTKLKDGSWGIRVAGEKPAIGAVLTIQKKDGSTRQETVSRVLWSEGGIVLCSIEAHRHRLGHMGQLMAEGSSYRAGYQAGLIAPRGSRECEGACED